ncbi:hypothetical protein HK405_008130, partial [Cladochytrium tenue]
MSIFRPSPSVLRAVSGLYRAQAPRFVELHPIRRRNLSTSRGIDATRPGGLETLLRKPDGQEVMVQEADGSFTAALNDAANEQAMRARIAQDVDAQAAYVRLQEYLAHSGYLDPETGTVRDEAAALSMAEDPKVEAHNAELWGYMLRTGILVQRLPAKRFGEFAGASVQLVAAAAGEPGTVAANHPGEPLWRR